MNLQYISDNDGEITGVIIPISEWIKLKNKFKELDQFDVPLWQKEEVNDRLEYYNKNPKSTLNFEAVMKDIEENL